MNIRTIYPAEENQDLRTLTVLESDLPYRKIDEGLMLIKSSYEKCLSTLTQLCMSDTMTGYHHWYTNKKQLLDSEMDKIIVLYKTLAFRQTALFDI